MKANLYDIMYAADLTEVDIYDTDTDFAGVCLCIPDKDEYDNIDDYSCFCLWVADHLTVEGDEGMETQEEIQEMVVNEGSAYVNIMDMMNNYRAAFETVLGDFDSYPEESYIYEMEGLLAGFYPEADYETLFNALANESVNRGEYELIAEEDDE